MSFLLYLGFLVFILFEIRDNITYCVWLYEWSKTEMILKKTELTTRKDDCGLNIVSLLIKRTNHLWWYILFMEWFIHFIPWVLIFYRLFELMTVWPFFALLLTQEKNRLRTTKEWHSITFGCIFMYIYLGLYIQKFFLVIVRTLLFQCVQALTVNYPGLWTRGIFDSKKRKIRI
jgi:hypothetical protein